MQGAGGREGGKGKKGGAGFTFASVTAWWGFTVGTEVREGSIGKKGKKEGEGTAQVGRYGSPLSLLFARVPAVATGLASAKVSAEPLATFTVERSPSSSEGGKEKGGGYGTRRLHYAGLRKCVAAWGPGPEGSSVGDVTNIARTHPHTTRLARWLTGRSSSFLFVVRIKVCGSTD